jgi:CubicO group peptidase (beta-lactamase class C family)
MNKLLAGFAAVLTLVVAGIAMSGQAPSRSGADRTVQYMDRTAQYYLSTGQFMGSVLVARADEVLFSRSYGSADLERKIANTPATKFRIGSVTKQFTAAAILILEDQGKLRLEDPIGRHLPNAPSAWDKVTLFHLLTHTSGIPRGVGVPNEPNAVPVATMEEHMAIIRDRPLEFEPGQRWFYSNSGYVLLGYVIERISGQSYEIFLREHIFTPLGMNDSGYDRNTSGVVGHAAGYSPGPNGPVNAEFVHLSRVHAAGGLHSTVEDLLKWERGLFGGKVLSAKSLEKMITPFKDNYGLGLLMETVDIRTGASAGAGSEHRRKEIEHSGKIQGFNTRLAYYPQDEITVAVLSNLNGDGPFFITREVAALAHR